MILTFYIRRQYPKIKFSGVKDKGVKKRLLKEMMYIQPSNIAGTLLRTFDNFLVVWLFGVAVNGTYSNYNMLVSYMSMLSVVITSSISATVGNIGASESPENCERIFRMTSICSFFPVAICTSLLFVMSGDIITLWLDKSNATGGSFSFILALFFLVMGLKRSVAVFREGFGLYRKEKIKPFFELVLSLCLSAFFGKKMGLSGVYLGQAISSVVCLLYEPYILYKYGFSKSVLPYYLLMLKYFFISFVSCACSFMLCRNIFSFSLKATVCIVLPLLFSFAAFYGREEMKTAMNYFLKTENKLVSDKGL
jgi:O-antigen/teichoic acid export membrane protein